MANGYSLAQIFGSQALGGLNDQKVDLLPGDPATLAQMYTGTPKEGSFWNSKGGSVLGSLLSSLALGAIGAGIGAIANPRQRGAGAAQGFGIGTGLGAIQDLTQRKAASAGSGNLVKTALEKSKQQSTVESALPAAIKTWQYGMATDPDAMLKKFPDFPTLLKFHLDKGDDPLEVLPKLDSFMQQNGYGGLLGAPSSGAARTGSPSSKLEVLEPIPTKNKNNTIRIP